MKVICAGGIVINKQGKVIVVNQHDSCWSLPKGHVEENEELLAAAKREIYEESGVSSLQLIKYLGSYERYAIRDSAKLKTIHIFLFTTDEDELKPTDPENSETRWVDKDEVEGLLTAEKDKEFFKGIKNQL